MIEVHSRAREWGNSIGVILPKEAIKEEHIRPGDTVTLLITKKSDTLRETFGKLKLKRSTEDILKEADVESWDE